MSNGRVANGVRLPLCQVLEEEYNVLKGIRPTNEKSPWLFEETHLITGSSSLAESLNDDENLVSVHLLWLLRQNNPATSPLTVVEQLNLLLQAGTSLYDEQAFAKVMFREDTHKLLQLSLRGDDVIYLNRVLLEDAYPNELKRIDDLHKARLADICRDGPARNLAALCLSGGGVRSATFNLGVLQGLARHGLLEKFDYLSTVSGGGYVAGWLEAWIARKEKTRQKAQSALKEQAEKSVSDDLQAQPKEKIDPEPLPLRHLRQHSNAMTPQAGLLSVDTWASVAIYLRNLLLNWLVIVPLLMAVLLLPKLFVALIRLTPESFWLTRESPWGWTILAVSLLSVLAVGFLCGGCALVYMGLHRATVYRGRPQARTEFYRTNPRRHFLWRCFLPLVVSAFAYTIYWAWLSSLFNRPDLPSWFPFLGNQATVPQWLHAARAEFPFLNDLPHLFWWMLAGSLFHGLCALVCAVWLWREGAKIHKQDAGWEFFAVLASGAVGGLLVWELTRIFPRPTTPNPIDVTMHYACFAPPLFLSLFLVAAALFVGLMSRCRAEEEDEDREWWARASAWVLIAVGVWSAINVLVIFGPVWLSRLPKTLASLGGVSGVITLVLGWNANTPANTPQEAKANWSAQVMNLALKAAAPLFAAFLVVVLSGASSGLMQWLGTALRLRTNWQCTAPLSFALGESLYCHLYIITYSPLSLLFGVFFSLLAFGLLMGSFFINVNKFSLHALYRNRLVRSYVGASHHPRTPDPFTGFDREDNLRMHELPLKPLHIVNIALNLVQGDNPAWQQRKAESFTVTPLHVGSFRLGYRRSKEYGKNDKGEAISLGTALAISGAAASPNMGYHSSSAITFLLTLFNIRLGWWLGNPGVAGSQTFDRSYPKFAIGPLLAETFGLTNDRNPYVYLSDGGHFENLGLYEMVLRRCQFIVVSDAGRDPKCEFEDLGNAIRKIRVDLGIPIELHPVPLPIYPRQKEKLGKYCAVGTIDYAKVDGIGVEPGILLYFKATFYGKEPIDVFHYAQANVEFPHEPTSDLWFNESQFESYRRLGLYTLDEAIAELSGGNGSEINFNNLSDWARKYKPSTAASADQLELALQQAVMSLVAFAQTRNVLPASHQPEGVLPP